MDTTKKLKYIYDAAYSLPTVPTVSSLYTAHLHKTSAYKGETMPPSLEGKYCEHCSMVFIPGVNMTMRVVFGKIGKPKRANNFKNKRQWKPRERKLRYYCHTCQKSTNYDLMKPEFNVEQGAKPLNKPFVAQWGENKKKKNTELKKVTSAKERAKKRKKNNLSNLLNSKKQKEEEDKKKSSLLSLEEFMKV